MQNAVATWTRPSAPAPECPLPHSRTFSLDQLQLLFTPQLLRALAGFHPLGRMMAGPEGRENGSGSSCGARKGIKKVSVSVTVRYGETGLSSTLLLGKCCL